MENNDEAIYWIWQLHGLLAKIIDLTQWTSEEAIAKQFRDWLDLLVTEVGKRANRISRFEARAINGLINFALDFVEHACKRQKLCFEHVLSLLYPIEDLMVRLASELR